jgi:hypothetical protein
VAVHVGLAHADDRGNRPWQPLDDGLLQQQVTCETVEPIENKHARLVVLDPPERLGKSRPALKAAYPFVTDDLQQDKPMNAAVLPDAPPLDVQT